MPMLANMTRRTARHRSSDRWMRRIRSHVTALILMAVVATPTVTPAGAASDPNSANRVIFWLSCSEILGLTNAELDTWSDRGVGGFACQIMRLRGMGGTQDFTGDPDANLAGPNYDVQRAFRDSDVVGRAQARGLKMYLGFWAVNYYNTATPFADWFANRGWSKTVIPRVGELAAGAKLLGFDGLAIDHELYPQTGGRQSAEWSWNYVGNTRNEVQTRDQAKQRGQEMMGAILQGFPGVEMMAYHVKLPESWEALVQETVNGIKNPFERLLTVDFWDGLSSVAGYDAIRFVDNIFYKGVQLPASWDTASQYNANTVYSLLSRSWSNWSYASSRFHLSPFSWIDSGKSNNYELARPPDYVAEQLEAYRKWGTGGEFANYAQGFSTFDYGPYVDGLQAAAEPGTVDSTPPEVEIVNTTQNGMTAMLTGTATDNLAIRSVRATNDRGGTATATMKWTIKSGDYRSGYNAETDWSIVSLPLEDGTNVITITAEDIKGLKTTTSVNVKINLPAGTLDVTHVDTLSIRPFDRADVVQ